MRQKTIAQTFYYFDELSDDAKEKAHDNWRNDGLDYEWGSGCYDQAKEIGSMMGIDIDRIYFSGFASQGDGACFDGSYQYKKGSVKAIKEYAPKDTDLHSIAEGLQMVQKAAFNSLSASVRQSGHYMHSGCTAINVYNNLSECDADGDQEDAITDLLREFMDWIYSSLDREHDYLNSDEAIDETITANEYEFDEFGNMV